MNDTSSYVYRVSSFVDLLSTLFDNGFTLEFRRNFTPELNEGHAIVFIQIFDDGFVEFSNPNSSNFIKFNKTALASEIERLFNDDFAAVLNP